MDGIWAMDNNAVLLFLGVNTELIVVPGMGWCDLLFCCAGLIIITMIFNDNFLMSLISVNNGYI